MYKMILLDDEIETRNRIQHILDFEKLGFEVKGLFDNGLDALNYIETNNDIDLVITDIKMPFMDGLQLATILKEKYPLIKVIVITGFDEFDYAKQAIESGVVGYIMKPITSEDFEKIVLRARKLLDDEKAVYQNIDGLEKYKQASKELLTESTLNLLIKETFDDYLAQTLSFLNINLNAKSFILFCIQMEESNFSQIEFNLIALKKLIDETILSKFRVISFNHKNKKVGIILNDDDTMNIALLDSSLNEIISKMKKFYNCHITIGVSSRSNGISFIKELYRQASHSLMHQSILGGNQVYHYDTISKKSNFVSNQEDFLKNLRYSIRYEGMKEIDGEIEKIKDYCLHLTNLVDLNFVLLDLSSSLLKCVEDVSKFYEKYPLDIYESLKDSSSLDETFSKLRQIILIIQEINSNSINTNFQLSTQKALDFIKTNYSNPDLNLEMLSAEINLSVSYLCALLKKEHNETFVKILTDIRMKKAMELLKNPNNKIVDVAEQVGYTEPYYFSHSFKKYTGLSPKEYKKSCQEEQ